MSQTIDANLSSNQQIQLVIDTIHILIKHVLESRYGVIGIGIILNGELYRGTNGFSGESGHMTIVKNGRKCNCGSSGCWEAYASEHALL